MHLDWIQYRANFREPVTRSPRRELRAASRMALAELAIDLRRVRPEHLLDDLADPRSRSVGTAEREPAGRVVVDDWGPLSESVIWRFNRLFWQRLARLGASDRARVRSGVAERSIGCP